MDLSLRKARESMAQAQADHTRKLTTYQKAVLIQVLRTFPDESVEICYAPDAGDAMPYAEDFLAVFKAIGRDVRGPQSHRTCRLDADCWRELWIAAMRRGSARRAAHLRD